MSILMNSIVSINYGDKYTTIWILIVRIHPIQQTTNRHDRIAATSARSPQKAQAETRQVRHHQEEVLRRLIEGHTFQ